MDTHAQTRLCSTHQPIVAFAAWWLALLIVIALPSACVVSSPSLSCLPCPCASGFLCAKGLCVPPEQQSDPYAFCFSDGASTNDKPAENPIAEKISPDEATNPDEAVAPDETTNPDEAGAPEEPATSEESLQERMPEEPTSIEKTTETTIETGPCKADADCPNNQFCDPTGQCRASECSPSRLCPNFLACINNRCQPCQIDDQCKARGSGYFCQSGSCNRKALSNNDVYTWSDGSHATDCMGYRYPPAGFEPSTQDGVYRIQPPNESAFLTHCLMRYAGGGWTLTLRVDGQKQTFAYNENLWTNRNTTSNATSTTALAIGEVKPASYWSVPFRQLLLHNASNAKSTPLIFGSDFDIPSTLALFQVPNNTQISNAFPSSPPPPPRSAWRAFFPNSSLQKYCNQIMVNFSNSELNGSLSNLRLGFVTDGDTTCKSPNGFIGIGGKARLLSTITAGNICTNADTCESNGTQKPALIGLYVRSLPTIKSTLKRVLGVLQPATGPVPPSCLAYRMPPHNQTTNDNYWIHPTSSPLPMITYCEMTRQGGGWTAILKANSTNTTFAYNANLWTNTATHNESPTVRPESTGDYKLTTYHYFPTEELLIAMHDTNQTFSSAAFFSLPFSAQSMLNAIQIPRRFDNEDPRPWRDLLPNLDLHNGCTQIGTSLTPAINNTYAHIRIGLIAAPVQSLNCALASSFVGIGSHFTACNNRNAPTVGHSIGCQASGSIPQNTPAVGYLFAR